MSDLPPASQPPPDDLSRLAARLTADAAEALIRGMPETERRKLFRKLGVSRLWQLGMVMCPVAVLNYLAEHARKHMERQRELLQNVAQLDKDWAETSKKLERMLPKPRNTERDEKIIHLRAAGKSHGQIAKLLKRDYPKINPNIVKKVVKRHRKTD